MTKFKDLTWPTVVFVAIFASFNIKDSRFFKRFRPVTVKTVLTQQIDSTKTTDSVRFNAFSADYRIYVALKDHIKYFSSSDTVVTVYDTSGKVVVESTSIKDLGDLESLKIKEIIKKKP